MPGTMKYSQTFSNRVEEFKEELVDCPYDNAHKIIPDRLVKHLVKCRTSLKHQYKTAINIKICEYNSSHHVHKADMEDHLKQCPSAKYYHKETIKKPVEVGASVRLKRIFLYLINGIDVRK